MSLQSLHVYIYDQQLDENRGQLRANLDFNKLLLLHVEYLSAASPRIVYS